MGKAYQDLAEDYLEGSFNFVWAAEKLYKSNSIDAGERIVRLSDPLTFLIAHAAELILKAALAFKKYDYDTLLGFRHDLNRLMFECQKSGVPLNKEMQIWVEAVSENFKNHDYRYPRSFGGFPSEEELRLNALIGQKSGEKELRKYGLVVKSMIEPELFIQAIKKQIEAVSLENQREKLDAAN